MAAASSLLEVPTGVGGEVEIMGFQQALEKSELLIFTCLCFLLSYYIILFYFILYEQSVLVSHYKHPPMEGLNQLVKGRIYPSANSNVTKDTS